MAQAMFERYGGFSTVSRIVMSFYDKLLDSPVTSPYFSGIDMKRLVDHQTRFVAFLMGGPASYTDDHLERVHARLGITEEAFLESIALLRDALGEFGVADEDVRIVQAAMMSRKHLIIANP